MADGHGGDGTGGALHGHAATEFADTHLERVAVNAGGAVTYYDPRDGSTWVLEYPDGEGGSPGRGFPRLRRQPN